MKKILLKTLFAVGIITMLSSCLGNSKSSTKFENAYGYMKYSSNYAFCAATSNGIAITSKDLNGLIEGRVYKMGAEVSFDNQLNDDIGGIAPVFQADYVNVLNGRDPLDRAESLIIKPDAEVENEIPMRSFGVRFYAEDKGYMDDVWVVNFICRAYKTEVETKDNIRFEAYLDPKDQFIESEDGTLEELAPNQAIVKVFAKRFNPTIGDPTEEKKDYVSEVSISLAEVRRYFEDRLIDSENDVDRCYIIFEYSGEDKDGNKPEKPTQIGSLTESTSAYTMFIDHRQN